jgi:biopolymer transport protein TolR
MGMSSGSSKGGVRSEVNVTPLIDVLLVLLIIFIVVMPIMMKKETLEVPHKLPPDSMVETQVQLLVAVKSDGSFTLDDGDKTQPIALADIAKTLRAKLDSLHAGTDKVVFVDFDGKVGWQDVISTMDTIRSLAGDVNHDEIKVALKVKDPIDEPGKSLHN